MSLTHYLLIVFVATAVPAAALTKLGSP